MSGTERERLSTPEDEATFRRLCRTLGSTGTSERDKRERGNALAQLKAMPAPERRRIFASVWSYETRKRRWQIGAAAYLQRILWTVAVELCLITGSA